MILYVFVLWNLVVNCNVLHAERQDFKLDDFEVESRKWTKPHSDVFSYSEEPLTDNLPEIVGETWKGLCNDQFLNAVQACQSRVSILRQRVKNIDIQVKRFVKHLVRIYSESKDSYEGVILMKITSDDMKVLKSFADDGIFSSHTHNNIHDLLCATFTLPTQSMKEKLLPMMNFLVRIPIAIWDLVMYVFHEIRLLLMQIVFSADLVIYASMFLPLIVLSLSLWRGNSMRTAFFGTAGMVAVIAYFVELRNAFEVARAKDMAKLLRSRNAPPECTNDYVGYFDWATLRLRSLFSSVDRCEQYYIDQIPEPTIEVSEVFWKIMFVPVTVAMDKFGYGLRQFMATFGKDFGLVTWVVVIPFAIVALILFLALVGAFINGGSFKLPFFGEISFGNSSSQSRESAPADAEPAQPQGNIAPPAAISNIVHFHFNSSHVHPTSQVTVPPNLNLALTSFGSPHGPTLQLTSSPSPDNNISSCSPNPSRQSISTFAEPERRTLDHRTISSPAGCLGQQQLTSASSPETKINNRGALMKVGSGDFVARDLSHRMLPSGVLRYRHLRKHSL